MIVLAGHKIICGQTTACEKMSFLSEWHLPFTVYLFASSCSGMEKSGEIIVFFFAIKAKRNAINNVKYVQQTQFIIQQYHADA